MAASVTSLLSNRGAITYAPCVPIWYLLPDFHTSKATFARLDLLPNNTWPSVAYNLFGNGGAQRNCNKAIRRMEKTHNQGPNAIQSFFQT
jgi:hypothetical protein